MENHHSRKVRTIVQTAMLMSILTLVSKCFGFLREMVMANFFGTTFVTDALVMSSSILSALFGGIIAAISTAYIPIYSKITEKNGKLEGDSFTSTIINILLLISLLISVFGILFSDQIISIFANGFQGDTASLASFYVRVLFSYVIFASAASILEAYLQYKGIFLPQIVSGYVISICSIIVIIISYYTSFYYLAFGILIGHTCRFFAIAFIAKKRGYQHVFAKKYNENIKSILILAFPAFVGGYMFYINQFVDKMLASKLMEGSISALNYASLLNNMIMGVTITVLSTIIYPKLTKANSLEQYESFNKLINTGMNVLVIIAMPCSLGAMLYSKLIIQIVYERGAFDSTATIMTSSAFFYYSLGMVFISISTLLTKVYYSIHDMKTPMIFAVIGVIINIVLNLILVQYMAHSGLALATSIAAVINTVLLYVMLRKKYKQIKVFDSKYKLGKITFAAAISVGISYAVYKLIVLPFDDIIKSRILQLMPVILIAAIVYYVLLHLLKIDEVKLIKQIIKKN